MDRVEILTFASKQIVLLREMGESKHVSIDSDRVYELVLEWIEENTECTQHDVEEFFKNLTAIIEVEIEVRNTKLQTKCIWLTK